MKTQPKTAQRIGSAKLQSTDLQHSSASSEPRGSGAGKTARGKTAWRVGSPEATEENRGAEETIRGCEQLTIRALLIQTARPPSTLHRWAHSGLDPAQLVQVLARTSQPAGPEDEEGGRGQGRPPHSVFLTIAAGVRALGGEVDGGRRGHSPAALPSTSRSAAQNAPASPGARERRQSASPPVSQLGAAASARPAVATRIRLAPRKAEACLAPAPKGDAVAGHARIGAVHLFVEEDGLDSRAGASLAPDGLVLSPLRRWRDPPCYTGVDPGLPSPRSGSTALGT